LFHQDEFWNKSFLDLRQEYCREKKIPFSLTSGCADQRSVLPLTSSIIWS
jgi:hypothetical protein